MNLFRFKTSSALQIITPILLIGFISFIAFNPLISLAQVDSPDVVELAFDPVGQSLNWIANRALEGATKFALNSLAYITVLIFTLGGFLIGLTLRLNSEVLNMSAVQTGWVITRDLANLGFVLGIVVIAFGTILRSGSYGMRSLLTKFITMALLINFSLVFAGLILDFAGILTAHFINLATPSNATGSWDDFATRIANIMRVDSLLQVKGDQVTLGQGIDLVVGAYLKNIASLIFIIIFTVLATVVFWGLAGMFLARFIHLAILLILMPLAWFSGIFPAINQSGRWWGSFLKWTFFAPISTFFIYLSIATIGDETSDGGLLNGISNTSSGLATSLKSSTVIFDVLGQIGTMIVVCGFLLGSLLASNVASNFGANWAIGSAKRMRNWATNKTKQYATRATISTARSISKGLGLETWAKNQQKAAREGRLSFWGKQKARLAQPIQQLQKAGGEKTMARYDSTVKDMTADSYALRYQQATDPALKARIMKEAIDKGKLDKLGPIDKKDISNFKAFGGNMKDLEKTNIFYAEDDKADKNISQLMADSIDKEGKTLSESIEKLSKALENKLSSMKPEELSKGQWLKMVNDGVGSGMTKEKWQGSEQQQALIGAMAKNWQGKEFSKAFGDASLSDRREMGNRLLVHNAGLVNRNQLADLYQVEESKLNDSMKHKDLLEVLKDHKNSKESNEIINKIKNTNESLYNYITKTLNSLDITQEEKDKSDNKSDIEKEKDKSDNKSDIEQEKDAGQEVFKDASGQPLV